MSDDLTDDRKVREQFFKITGAKYITDGQVLVRLTFHYLILIEVTTVLSGLCGCCDSVA